MTIRRMQVYRTVLLIFTGVWICLTDGLKVSSACPGDAVYHYATNKCFFIKNIQVSWHETQIQCDEYKGGAYGNITGSLASVNKYSEGFLRDYLKYMGVSNAVVTMQNYGFESQALSDLRTKNFEDCDDSDTVVDMEYLVMLAESQETSVNWKQATCDYTGSAICQVEGAEVVSKKSSCPSNVTVESVSESEVTFNMTPGKTNSQVKVIFRAHKPCKTTKASLCGEQTTTYSTFFLGKPTTTTYLELESNSSYKAQFVIEKIGGSPFDCNSAVDFKTLAVQEQQEENCNGEVVGLSIVLVCSLCVTVVLAIIYCRLRKSTGQDIAGLSTVRLMMSMLKRDNRAKSTVNTYSDSGVGTTKNPSNVGKGSVSQNKRSNSDIGDYTNVQVTAPNYDVTENEQDDHVYEL